VKIQSNFRKTCTLGFSAKRYLTGEKGFVTNSHCTNVQGGVESTVFYQPTASGNNRIGVEIVDPVYWSGANCPVGRLCRYSDTAFVRWDAGISMKRHIAKPLYYGGSLKINHNASFRVTGEDIWPDNGEILYKVGERTGWSGGAVDRQCVDVNAQPPFTFLCQDHVLGVAGGGDSGSPVFRITNSPGFNDVTLLGILHGTGGDGFWFSDMWTIQFSGEMGTLDTCASGFNC
jgi:hypothetical protein